MTEFFVFPQRVQPVCRSDLAKIKTRQAEACPTPETPELLRTLNWMRHDVAGFLWQARALELHGDVRDVEILFQPGANRLQDSFAFIHVHVRNARVARERHHVRSNRPDMNVVDFLHAFDA